MADVDVVLEGSFALFEAVEATAEAAEAVGALVPGAAAVALVAAFPAAAATSAGFLSAVSRVNASTISAKWFSGLVKFRFSKKTIKIQ